MLERLAQIPVGMVRWVRSVEKIINQLINDVDTIKRSISLKTSTTQLNSPVDIRQHNKVEARIDASNGRFDLSTTWHPTPIISATGFNDPDTGPFKMVILDGDELNLFSYQMFFRVLPTAGSTANLFIDPATQQVKRSTSSRKYKRDIEPFTAEMADEFLEGFTGCLYKMLDDDEVFPGAIAEEVYELPHGHLFVDLDEHGEPTSIRYALLIVPLIISYLARRKDTDGHD